MTILAYIGGFAMEHPLLAIAIYFGLVAWAFGAYEEAMSLRRRA